MLATKGAPVLIRQEVIPAGKGAFVRQVTRIGKPELTPYWATRSAKPPPPPPGWQRS
jgi:hypothetical protein